MFKFNLLIDSHIDINCKQNVIKDIVCDFENWPKFSPWMRLDKDAKIKQGSITCAIGSKMSWVGKYIGTGSAELVTKEDECMCFELEFIKPFKSKAKTFFVFERIDDNTTRVYWRMLLSLPLYMFFFKKSFKNMLSCDYKRGLKMLKSLAETKKVESDIVEIGISSLPDSDYLGIKVEKCHFDDLPSVMARNFEKLNFLAGETNTKNAKIFSIYHEMDIKNMMFSFSTAISFENCHNIISDSEIYNGKIEVSKLYRVRHTGEWNLLGNAWKFGMMRCFGKNAEYKYDKPKPSYEVYESIENPKVTDVCISIK